MSTMHGSGLLSSSSSTASRPVPVPVPLSNHSPASNSAAFPEPPTPAPSPGPFGSGFFYAQPSQSPALVEDPYSTSLAHLARDFSKLARSQREALLSALLDACDTSALSFVLAYVSPLLKKDPFKVLPNEICLRILSHVDDARTLARAAQVSRRWASVVSDDITWKGLCERLHYKKPLLDREILPTAPGHFSPPFVHTPAYGDAAAFSLPQNSPNVTTMISVSSPPSSTTPLTAIPISVTSTTTHNGELSMMESTYLPVVASNIRPLSYRTLFKQRYMVDSAWLNGGVVTARHVTTDQGVVTCLHLTKKYVVVALDNSRIHVFTSEGRLIHTLTGHVMGVWAIMPWDDTLVSGGCDRDVRVWDLKTGRCKMVLHGHTSTVRCLKMSDSRTAISGSRDASLRVWDIETSTCKHVLLGHQASVRCLEVFGDICVSGSYDTTAKVWSISRGVLLHTLAGHFSQIYALAFDGVKIATGSLDTSVRIWSAESGQCFAVLQGHTSLVGQLQMLGDTLVTGSSDGSTRVWDLKGMTCVHRLAAHDNSVTTLQFDEHRIVTGGSDGRVKVWDIKTGHHIRDLPCTYEAVWRIAFEDEKAVVLASRHNRTHMEVISFAPQVQDWEH
ncbi:WD40-repeat-containing domain protein [Lipomyces doorenjongii]|uniref:WD40-repeat-containing domain protein n=1 Tax=Lipomyces doorenjongii TaxID=383834 RepID=UPI0034CD0FDD